MMQENKQSDRDSIRVLVLKTNGNRCFKVRVGMVMLFTFTSFPVRPSGFDPLSTPELFLVAPPVSRFSPTAKLSWTLLRPSNRCTLTP